MLLSIIVPVYNVAMYLHQCLDSIIAYNSTPLEIILVNDGSTDESGDICDTYAAKDDRVTVIHQTNGGASAARNVGLARAKGDYILFVDSDDWIEADVIHEMMHLVEESANDIDLVFLEGVHVYESGVAVPIGDGYDAHSINGQGKTVVMQHLASLPKFPGSACTKLIRRGLLVAHRIKFEEGIYAEDIDFVLYLLKAAKRFAYIQQPYYYYRQRAEGSRTSKPNAKMFLNLLQIIERHSSGKGLTTPTRNVINSFLAYEYVVLLYLFTFLSKRDQRRYGRRLDKRSWLLRYGRTGKTKLARWSYLLFGQYATASLLRLYKEIDVYRGRSGL